MSGSADADADADASGVGDAGAGRAEAALVGDGPGGGFFEQPAVMQHEPTSKRPSPGCLTNRPLSRDELIAKQYDKLAPSNQRWREDTPSADVELGRVADPHAPQSFCEPVAWIEAMRSDFRASIALSRMGSIERFLAHAGVAWCCVSTSARAEAPAEEPTRAQCLSAHEQAQASRLASQLLAARAALRECTAAACPSLVSHDCGQWLSEVEQQIPSVIFRAAKDGEDVVALRVREGDELLTSSLTGSPLELDPGPHHFVAELPGFPAQEATYVLQAGDKARVVRFEFASPKPSLVSGPPPPAVVPPAAPVERRPIPTLSYALGGVTLTAAVTGGVLGGLALAKRGDAQKECAPLCPQSDVRSVQHLALAADVAFAVALLGAGATVFSYVTRPSVLATENAAAPPPLRVRVLWTGWGMAASGSF